MRTSTDDGATWSDSNTISGRTVIARDGMLGIATLDNESALIAIFETTEYGRFMVSRVISHDGGSTWGEHADMYVPADGKQAGVPQIVNVGGTLVASSMTNEDGPNRPGAIDGAAKILASMDSKNTWNNKFTLFPPRSNWPGLALLHEDHFNVMDGVSGEGAIGRKIELT